MSKNKHSSPKNEMQAHLYDGVDKSLKFKNQMNVFKKKINNLLHSTEH